MPKTRRVSGLFRPETGLWREKTATSSPLRICFVAVGVALVLGLLALPLNASIVKFSLSGGFGPSDFTAGEFLTGSGSFTFMGRPLDLSAGELTGFKLNVTDTLIAPVILGGGVLNITPFTFAPSDLLGFSASFSPSGEITNISFETDLKVVDYGIREIEAKIEVPPPGSIVDGSVSFSDPGVAPPGEFSNFVVTLNGPPPVPEPSTELLVSALGLIAGTGFLSRRARG